MKLIIFGIDGASFNFIKKYKHRFDLFSQMIDNGAYAKMMPPKKPKGWMYTSMDIWTSLYCGLHPDEHKLEGAFMRDEITGKECIRRLKDLAPEVQERYFWKILNKRGYKVGLYDGMMFNPTFEIEGFVYGTYPNANGDKFYPHTIKKHFRPVNSGNVSPFPLHSFGHDSITNNNVEQIYTAMKQTYYYHGVTQLFSECMSNYNNLVDIMQECPVDVLFFYAANLDIIQHFQLHEESDQSIIEAYQMFESFIQRIMFKYDPDNIIILSDHGFAPSTDGAKPKGCKACLSMASNKGILSGSHAEDAILMMYGNDIKEKGEITADIISVYGKILEVCK